MVNHTKPQIDTQFLHAGVVHFTWTRGIPQREVNQQMKTHRNKQPFIWSNNLLPSVSFTHQIIRYESWIPCMSKSHVGSTNWFCCFLGYLYFIDPPIPFKKCNESDSSPNSSDSPHTGWYNQLWESTTSKDLHLIMQVKGSIRQSHIINRGLYSYYLLLIPCKSYHAYYSGTMTFITHDILIYIYIIIYKYCICMYKKSISTIHEVSHLPQSSLDIPPATSTVRSPGLHFLSLIVSINIRIT